MTWIVLGGAPGSGKSTLARALSSAFEAPILDKDRVREALFGPRWVEYSREQDDHCARLVYESAAWLARRGRTPFAILDGRTFGRASDVDEVLAVAHRAPADVCWIACTAAESVLGERIAHDRRAGVHPAANRDEDLLERWLARREPWTVPHLTLDTGDQNIAEQVAAVRAFVLERTVGP